MHRYSGTSPDWGKVYFDPGSTITANLSMSGGSEKNTYFVSGSYYELHPTVKGNSQQRFTARMNNDYKFLDNLKVKLSMGISYNIKNLFSTGTDYYDILPVYDPYNSDGSVRHTITSFNGYDRVGDRRW